MERQKLTRQKVHRVWGGRGRRARESDFAQAQAKDGVLRPRDKKGHVA